MPTHRASEATDWAQVLHLYDQLLAVRPNPVVALNRAVALAEMDGPLAGLAALDTLHTPPSSSISPTTRRGRTFWRARPT